MLSSVECFIGLTVEAVGTWDSALYKSRSGYVEEQLGPVVCQNLSSSRRMSDLLRISLRLVREAVTRDVDSRVGCLITFNGFRNILVVVQADGMGRVVRVKLLIPEASGKVSLILSVDSIPGTSKVLLLGSLVNNLLTLPVDGHDLYEVAQKVCG